tara:strand:- start:1289 stop:1942 length:654 start_codon:yes stop_codon:yes gene_type:complete
MKIEINVPTSLEEITLGQYQKYLKIAESNPNGNFLDAKMIEIFCGIPLLDAYKLKVSSVTAIIEILEELLDSKPKHVERFKLNGIEYGFIPDLDEMSLGEYIDLDTTASNWEQMQVAMNVLYRPIKDSKAGKYNIEDYNISNSEDMKSAPMSAVVGSLFFFLNLGIELSSHTIRYLDNREEMEDILKSQILTENGDGINLFLHSLTEILQDLKISLN